MVRHRSDVHTTRIHRTIRLGLLAVLAVLVALALLVGGGRAGAAECKPKRQLAWGGSCYRYASAVDRTRFALWLRDRGVIEQWARKHPRAARRFGRYFPPTPDAVRRAAIRVFSASSNPNAVDTALCIIGRESGFRFDAYSATDDVGPFQFNIVHWGDGVPPMLALMDPLFAARQAFTLSQGGYRWSPWYGGRYGCGY